MLSHAAQLEIDTQKAIKANKRKSRRQPQPGDSSKGDGITPEDEDIKEPKVDWVYTDDEANDDDEDDDDQNAEKVKEERANEEQKKDGKAKENQAEDDQLGALVIVIPKEKSDPLLSTSDHSLSSNYGHDDEGQDDPLSYKKAKKRSRTKDAKPSKKSSHLRNLLKVKLHLSVQEPEHEVPMDAEEPNLDNMANDVEEPQEVKHHGESDRQAIAGKENHEELRSVGWWKENRDGQTTIAEDSMTSLY
nr:hypothetical protein [Tanacetum cinerariifolium]